MYDWPETAHALDNLWYSIQKKLNSSEVYAPKFLTRGKDAYLTWQDPNLLIGQACGWPYANRLRHYCKPFACIDYDIKDCPPGTYNCVYIGQSKKDIRFLKDNESLIEAKKIAINSSDSQSGFHVFKEITKTPSHTAIPESIQYITGSHRNSIKAVAEGNAQIAAVDTICFELARRHDPDIVKNVSVLGRSIAKPAPVLMTSHFHKGLIPALLEAIAYGIYNLSEEDKETLLIKGLTPCNDINYDVYI